MIPRRTTMAGAACVLVLLCSVPGIPHAQDQADSPCAASQEAAAAALRRRPGVTNPDTPQSAACDPTRMPPPSDASLPEPAAIPDRWRLVEQLGRPISLVDPFAANNPMKGDRPIFGDDVFLSFSASSNTLLEPRLVPTTEQIPGVTGGIRTAAGDQFFLSQTMTFDTVLYKGDTVFRPPDWQWRFTPAINYSATAASSATASGGVVAVQALSFEKHLRDVSAHYDFDSVRIGIQPLVSDFRGFLLSDQPLAARLFGTRDDNVFQYNLALITRLPKDRVRLNALNQGIPNDQIVLANLYWQDLFKPGSTSEFIFAFNRNRATAIQTLLGADGTISGSPVNKPRDYDVAYLGYSLDGHFGRLNTTAAVYALGGREQRGMFVDQSTQVRALFAADEFSMDFDWRRVRLSMLHASGDGNPYDRREGGFDTLTSGAIFAGSDSSFFFHQRLALAGGVFDLKSRDGLLPSLRPAGNSEESNFSNPGLNLLGVGLDLSLTPQLTLSLDANQLWFDKTATLEALLNQPSIPRRMGAEVVADAIWRPFASQNVILRLSGSQLITGPGYRAIYGGSNPYSVFALLILNY